MLLWIFAVTAGFAVAALEYQRHRHGRMFLLPALLRVVAATFVAALALDAPMGRESSRVPFVVLDASASWKRGRADTVWQHALERARSAARGDTLWLAGDSLRPAGATPLPQDGASKAENAVDRAVASGRPLVFISDGEIDDAAAFDRALAGSRTDIATTSGTPDAAVLALELPRSTVGGDSVELVVRLVAGSAGAPAGTASVTLDRVPLIRVPFDALAPFAERDVRANVRVPVEGGEHRTVRAVLSAQGDGVAMNDSLSAVLDVASVPRGVFVSTAPDQDSRFALEVLRGTLAIAVRAYYRVAPGTWRQEPGFTSVAEAEVKKALSEAPIAIIHGDTTIFGAPRALTTGALALLVPGAGDGDEWFAIAAASSPLTGALTGVPWDSLPPIAIGPAPRGDWTALSARRARTMRDERVLIAGTDESRRIAVVVGSGYWRWRFRGGVSADAFAAMWGGLFDWMAAGGDDRRAAIPATAFTRAGDAVEWRRGARRDTSVAVRLRSLDGNRVDSVTLRFPGDAIIAESPPLPAGEYDVTLPGGHARLVVGASREWLPRRASLASGTRGTVRARGRAPRLRDAWWPYVVALAALCAEWLVRRRAGLR